MGALGVVAFAAATWGADIAARMAVGGEGFGEAASEHLYFATARPLTTLCLFAPFALLALVCAAVEDKSSRRRGVMVFGAFGLVMIGLYFRGYAGAQHALSEAKWTAAALSIGFLPLAAIPVLLAAVIVAVAATKAGR